MSGRVYDLANVRGKPSGKSPEGAIRYGLKKCGECRQQFTAKVGTVFEHARKRAFHHKMKVLALVDRDTGRARTMVIDAVNADTLMPIALANVAREARVMRRLSSTRSSASTCMEPRPKCSSR